MFFCVAYGKMVPTGGEDMEFSGKMAELGRLSGYVSRLRREPELVYLFFELTDACNLSCLHCGSGASPRNRQYLSMERMEKVLTEVAERYDTRRIMVCLTGGEPMLHPDFYQVAKQATELGFGCGITTNGTLIDEAAANRMADSGIRSVTFSLDGMAGNHDWFRNRPGSFTQTLEGVKHLVAAFHGRGVTQITTVVHRKNIGELEQVYDLVRSLGVSSWRLINLDPIGRALEHEDLLLQPEEFRFLLDYIRDKRRNPECTMDVTYGCSHYLPLEYEHEVRDYYFLCGAGICVGSVLCNGDIYACLDVQRRPELIQGNVDRDNFVDVWENRFRQFREDRTERCGTCRNCGDRQFCRGDGAHTWDYDRQRPLICVRRMLEGESNE